MEEIITRMQTIADNQQRILKENAELKSMMRRLLEREAGGKEVMNSKEVADYLGVSVGRVRNMVYLGEIPVCKNATGSRNFFRREDIDNWRANRRIKTNAEIRQEIMAREIFRKEKGGNK